MIKSSGKWLRELSILTKHSTVRLPKKKDWNAVQYMIYCKPLNFSVDDSVSILDTFDQQSLEKGWVLHG